jgi:hypothetical protein
VSVDNATPTLSLRTRRRLYTLAFSIGFPVRTSGRLGMATVYTGLMNTTLGPDSANRPIVSLHKFCQEAGISGVTAWRWRKAGWLSTVNIAGRPYLTGEAIADFLRRAKAEEFAKEHKAPRRHR